MSTRLIGCPVDIIERIVKYLDLDDIRTFRLCSRSVAANSAHGHFRSFFRSKHVEIRIEALQDFIEMIRSSAFGGILQHLSLVGLAKATEDDPDSETETASVESSSDDGDCARLLGVAFTILAGQVAQQGLASLSLEISLVDEIGQRVTPSAAERVALTTICEAAGDTFALVFEALRKSRLPVVRLNLFDQAHLQRCSLACDELSKIDFSDRDLVAALHRMQSLSVSLSNKRLDEIYRTAVDVSVDAERLRNCLEDDENFAGLQHMVEQAKNLKQVDIHYFRLKLPFDLMQSGDMHDQGLLKRLNLATSLPKLQSCTLRGLRTHGHVLLEFLKQTEPQSLVLKDVTLLVGAFRQIFDYCTSEAANMEELFFDDVTENEIETIYFDGPGKCGAPKWSRPARFGPIVGSQTLRLSGDEVRQTISYRYLDGPAIGGMSLKQWQKRQLMEYGPL